MSIKRQKLPPHFKFICSFDDAIADGYDEYKKNFDESKLSFHEGKQPTRFIVRTMLDWDAAKAIKSEQFKISQKGQANFDISYMMNEVRMAVIGIEDPSGDFEFKKDDDGYMAKDLYLELEALGVTAEIFAARTAYMQKQPNIEEQKKS